MASHTAAVPSAFSSHAFASRSFGRLSGANGDWRSRQGLEAYLLSEQAQSAGVNLQAEKVANQHAFVFGRRKPDFQASGAGPKAVRAGALTPAAQLSETANARAANEAFPCSTMPRLGTSALQLPSKQRQQRAIMAEGSLKTRLAKRAR